MKIVIESPEKLTDSICRKLLTCGIEKVDGFLCQLSFRLLSHYIMHTLTAHALCQALININMNFYSTIFRRGEKCSKGGSPPPPTLNKTLAAISRLLTG